MSLEIYSSVSAEEVAEGMIRDPEFAMDILAELASRADECHISDGDSGSDFHSRVPEWLESVALALKSNAN